MERAYNGRVAGVWGSGLTELATDHIIDTVGYHLIPMYRFIGPAAAVVILVLFLIGVVRMLLDILIRAIAIAKIRGCGLWMLGAFWSTLYHLIISPLSWASDVGHRTGKQVNRSMDAEAAYAKADHAGKNNLDAEPSERKSLINVDKLMNWTQEVFWKPPNNQQLYPGFEAPNVQVGDNARMLAEEGPEARVAPFRNTHL